MKSSKSHVRKEILKGGYGRLETNPSDFYLSYDSAVIN